MTRPSPARIYTLVLAMTVFWAINFVIAKIALRELSPLSVAGLRAAFAGGIMVPLFAVHAWRSEKPLWTRQDLPVLLFLALLGVALNQVFFVLGMARTSVAHAAVIIAMTPVWVLLLAASMKIEKLGAGRLLGMAVAFGGVFVLQTGPSRGGQASLPGDLLIFCGSAVFAIFTTVGKRVSKSFDTITLNTFAYVLGGAMLLPFAWWDLSRAGLDRVSTTGWVSVVYMAAIPSVLCYLIYYYALRWMPASRLSAFSYMQPLIATTFAVPMLGEQPTPAMLGGGALVLAGVMMTERL